MPVKGFDSVADLGDAFDTEVFRAVSDDMLFVFDRGKNAWHRYRWTRGKREIRFVDTHQGELPLVTQVYPSI